MQAPVVCLDRQARVLWANGHICALLGRKPGEIIGRDWFGTFVALPWRYQLRERHAQHMSGAKPCDCRLTYPLLAAAGGRVEVHWHQAPLTGRDGQIDGVALCGIRQTYCDLSDASLQTDYDERFFAVFANSALPIALFRPDGRWMLANQAFCQLLGYEEAELAAMDNLAITHPDDIAKTKLAVGRLLDEGDPESRLEMRFRNKNGSVVWVDLWMGALREQEDRLEGILVLCTDLTARVDADRALQQSEEQHRSLFETLPLGVIYQDEQGQITAANRAAETILGLSASQMEGRTSQDPGWRTTYPDGSPFPGRDHPAMVALRTGLPILGVVMGFYNPNMERVRWLKVDAVPLFRPDDERPRQVISIFSDITERLTAEQDLERYRQLLDEAGRMAKIGGWELDVVSRALTWTNEVFRIHEVATGDQPSLEQAISFYAPEAQPIIEGAVEAAIERGEPFDLELPIITAKGGRKWLHAQGKATWQNGRVVKVSGVVQDITRRRQTDDALRESRERFQLAAAGASDGLWDWYDLEGGKAWASDRYFELLGYAPGEFELTYQKYQELLHPDDRAGVQAAVAAHLERRAPFDIQFRMRDKDGSYRWFRGRGQATWDSYGRPRRMSGSIQYTHDQRLAEEALRHSEHRFRQAITEAPQPIMIHTEDGEIIQVNRVWCELSGYSRAEMPTLDAWVTLAHGESGPRVHEAIRRAFDEQRTKLGESVVRAKDGSRLVWDFSAAPLGSLPDGRRLLLSMATDVTARHQAQESLRETNRALEMAQDMAALGYWSFDVASQKARWSSQMFAILGWDPARGEPCLEDHRQVIHPQDWELFASEVKRVAQHGGSYDLKLRVVHPDGAIRHINTLAHGELSEDGTVERLFGITQDITDRHIAEEEKSKLEFQLLQAQKMEAIGTLAGGIAHDFNNILSAMIGYTEIAIDETPPDGGLRDVLANVLKAGRRARDLVKHILSFSRQTQPEVRPLRLAEVLDEALKLLRASLPSTIQISRSLEGSRSAVMADATQIHQVVMNLCTNAAHAMRQQGGTLTVRLDEVVLDEHEGALADDLPAGRYARITLRDSGHGMDRAVRERIFDPFFTTKPKGEGTGLGLSVVHGIVKSHQGGIKVYSEPGKGTQFLLYFPILKEQPADLGETVSTGILPRGSEHILLVDDEEMLLDMTQRLLARLGYRVTTTPSSRQALEMVTQYPGGFDLVITDFTMPGLTGEELAKQIMQVAPKLPIILSTGFSEMINEERALGIGIKRFLLKPVLPNKLAGVIREVLDEAVRPAPVRPARTGEDEPRHATILFVDDEVELYRAVQRSLRRSEMTLLHADCGEKALEIYRADPSRIDLVVLDISMPGMGGQETARRLLEMNPDLPIIMSSGYGEEDPGYQAVRDLVRGYLEKPYQTQKLLETVRQTLAGGPLRLPAAD